MEINSASLGKNRNMQPMEVYNSNKKQAILKIIAPREPGSRKPLRSSENGGEEPMRCHN